MLNSLKRLSYRPEVTALAHSLRISSFARSLYYSWAAPGGIARVYVRGVRAQFFVSNSSELRALEGAALRRTTERGERHILELMIDSARPGSVFYDVGANFGLYSVLLGKAMRNQGQVIAFEPDSRNYDRLMKNLQLNELTNVRCCRKALGEESSKASLYYSRQAPCSSTLLAPPIPSGVEVERVEVAEGDQLVSQEDLPIPSVVKIDVEGYEYSVIQGLRNTLAQPACKLVAVEIHPHLLPPPFTRDQILNRLKSYGFSRMNIYARGAEEHALGYKPCVLSTGVERPIS